MEEEIDELTKTKLKIKEQEEELAQLRLNRITMEAEVQDLTASLFEQANKMVNDAAADKFATEKCLKEAQLHIEGLTAEVSALKTLVLTSTPSNPNFTNSSPGKSKFFGHKKCPSHGSMKVPPVEGNPAVEEEVDPAMLSAFQHWHDRCQSSKLSLDSVDEEEDEFFKSILNQEIIPCLDFPNAELSEKLKSSLDSVIIERRRRSGEKQVCALLEAPRDCKFVLKLSEDEDGVAISESSRNRITAVCDCLNYLKYIQRGMVKACDEAALREILRLRKNMALAKLGFSST